MGKLSDALERSQKENVIMLDRAFSKKPKSMPLSSIETEIAREFCTLHTCHDDLVVVSDPNSPEAENFKILRAQILFASNRERPRTILVTSALPGEGKTYVSANLGVSLALGIDEFVLMVDCDLRRPRLHNLLNHSNVAGLHEYLLGDHELSELITRTGIGKLSFLPAGKPPLNPSELLSSQKMTSFIQEVRDRYPDRFIVIDSPPCEVAAEVTTLAKYVDAVVLVVRTHTTPRKLVHHAVDKIGRQNILGVAVNGCDQAYNAYRKYYRNYYHPR